MAEEEKYGCIVLTTQEWFNKCLSTGCKVFHFPPGRSPRGIEKLADGSICLVLARPLPRAPRSMWAFLGEFTAKKIARVSANEFIKRYSKLAVEVSGSPFPRYRQWCWVIEFSGLIKYRVPVRLGECSDIAPLGRKPLSEWAISGFTLIRPENTNAIINGIRTKAGHISAIPSHDELVKMIRDIGEWLSFVVEVNEETPDKVYKLDVTWRDAPGHAPLKAFEVDVKGDVDKALARLSHAKDVWNCEQLYLVVSDEAKASRAVKLVEPFLKGSFARIKDRLTVLGSDDVINLYHSLSTWRELLVKLSKR